MILLLHKLCMNCCPLGYVSRRSIIAESVRQGGWDHEWRGPCPPAAPNLSQGLLVAGARAGNAPDRHSPKKKKKPAQTLQMQPRSPTYISDYSRFVSVRGSRLAPSPLRMLQPLIRIPGMVPFFALTCINLLNFSTE